MDVVTIERPKRENVHSNASQLPIKWVRPTLVKQKSTSTPNSAKQSRTIVRQSGRREDYEEEEEIEKEDKLIKSRKKTKYGRLYRKELQSKLYTFCMEIPAVNLIHERVSKTLVLEKGVDYIKKLKNEEESLLAELGKAKKRNQELLKKLKLLS